MDVQLLHKDAIMPSRATPGAAGLDLYSAEDVALQPGGRALTATGVAMTLPTGHVGLIWPRSGLAVKSGVDVLAGVVDCDYRGEVKVALINHGDRFVFIEAGDRIAQMIIQRYSFEMPTKVDRLGRTHRGDRGFGSTGE